MITTLSNIPWASEVETATAQAHSPLCLHAKDSSICGEWAYWTIQLRCPTIWKQRGDVPEWVFPKAPVSYEIYSKTHLNAKKSSLGELVGTIQQPAPVDRIEPVLAGYNWTQQMVPSRLQTRSQPPKTAPLESIHYEPSGNSDEDSEAVKKVNAELEELEKSYDRQSADEKRANELEYQMNLDTLRSMERSREFIGTIRHDRDYIIKRHYNN
ncbi:unnamed protein product [Clonostachys rhizophaga]|uniref:Uncharacterized protein n=1 Tax=Clonostachys rhizophaga TaxID=160324 RepID=A0A9N9YHL0_9HYPO|nr:unnamed protein product [Clonostachys rhizophaga]